jgi:parallel beta-helix repeat protein
MSRRMGRWMVLLLITAAVITTGGAEAAESIADSFRFPLDGSWTVTQDFNVYNSDFGGYHLGEDVLRSSEVPVYAPANGIVKHNSSRTSYGYVVIIEHELQDGTYVCSVLGHLRAEGRASIGSEVTKGQIVGYLSSDPNENGGYNFTHLHFGIRKGNYSSTWVYWGYGSSSEVNNWHDPSDFVNSHQGASILDQSIYPTVAAPGDELTFVYNISNPYNYSTGNIRLGAQIRTNAPQGTWIDDPGNDKVITLLPGAHDYSRKFIIPQSAVSGFYDANWVILNHTAGSWIDSKNMTRIFEVRSSGLTVCPIGCDYTRIQDAINASSAGDTILVYSGTYYENVNVSKRLILRGVDTGGGKPVVDAGWNESAITLSASGSTLDGFVVTNVTRRYPYYYAGIMVVSNNNIVENNNASNYYYGYGIYLYYSSNNTLSSNTASNYYYGHGIYLYYSSNNTLSGNTASNNYDGYGIYLYSSSNNMLSSNTASNNYEGHGIYLYYSSNNTLSGNTASNNHLGAGILLISSSNNTLSSNNASLNNYDGYGILLISSSNNMLSGNNASNNWYGIYLNSSSNNLIHHNNLINNAYSNAYDDGANLWNATYPSGGNYWSDYTGADLKSGPSQNLSGSDGIGDTPYNISGGAGAQDRYPFMRENGWLKLSLNVEKIYQYSDPWGKEIYDDALNWTPKPRNPNISRWGCALTSAVMVLKYHGADTDPSKLNKWLNENNGYINGNINWYAVANSSSNVSINGRDIIPIKSGNWSKYKPIVDDALLNGQPVIAGVYMKIGKAPDHWVVITGKTEINGNETYTINDPANALRTTLLDYNDMVYGIRIYKPAIKNNEVLQIIGKSPIELYVTDPYGRHTGINPLNGSEVNEIPSSTYYYENIADEVDNESSPDIKILEIIDPLGGSYNISVIGTDTGNYSIDINSYNEFGNQTSVCNFSGSTKVGDVQSFEIMFNFTPPAPPSVTNATANQSDIPDDTDNEPLWGETAQLNVTVTDESNISSVTINLSEIGGLSANPMLNIGGNIYSTTTNASAGTLSKLYNLTVNATDIFGNSNTSVVIQLRVMKNGDTTGNGFVNIGDALRLANNVSYPGNPDYALSSIYAADVTGDGKINIGDALRLANNVSYPGNPAYILK